MKGHRFEDRGEICSVTEKWLLAQPPTSTYKDFQGQEQMAEMYIFGWWLGREIKVSMQKI